MGRRLMLAVALGATLGALTTGSSAQAVDLYYIHGTVTDTHGAPIAGASVRNGGQTGYSDADGGYRLGQLVPGSHTIRASRQGCAAEVEHVTVLIPQDTEVNFALTCDE